MGGFRITPVRGSSGPGAQIPIPATEWRPLGRALEMADRIASKPSAADPFATMGIRFCERISPLALTSPAATLVPPISTPTNRLSGKLGAAFRAPVTLAVGFGSADSVEQDIEVANRSENERVVNTLSPTGSALNHRRIVGVIDGVTDSADNPRNDGAADDRHVENA